MPSYPGAGSDATITIPNSWRRGMHITNLDFSEVLEKKSYGGSPPWMSRIVFPLLRAHSSVHAKSRYFGMNKQLTHSRRLLRPAFRRKKKTNLFSSLI